eukprot:CAMPEP_0178988564 /NCGR_PEP_ID=MMETSP0795-20121207/3876_1 /TAXON_ID=88552 /ORGANISM="Amoebophrya sp., Strain Ameob2" /LENGTH=1288 /DNA_ID=CAMNT_0020679843 /DNA_START=355 /DNA_END=4221 /DNA_ORIENTATION=+
MEVVVAMESADGRLGKYLEAAALRDKERLSLELELGVDHDRFLEEKLLLASRREHGVIDDVPHDTDTPGGNTSTGSRHTTPAPVADIQWGVGSDPVQSATLGLINFGSQHSRAGDGRGYHQLLWSPRAGSHSPAAQTQYQQGPAKPHSPRGDDDDQVMHASSAIILNRAKEQGHRTRAGAGDESCVGAEMRSSSLVIASSNDLDEYNNGRAGHDVEATSESTGSDKLSSYHGGAGGHSAMSSKLNSINNLAPIPESSAEALASSAVPTSSCLQSGMSAAGSFGYPPSNCHFLETDDAEMVDVEEGGGAAGIVPIIPSKGVADDTCEAGQGQPSELEDADEPRQQRGEGQSEAAALKTLAEASTKALLMQQPQRTSSEGAVSGGSSSPVGVAVAHPSRSASGGVVFPSPPAPTRYMPPPRKATAAADSPTASSPAAGDPRTGDSTPTAEAAGELHQQEPLAFARGRNMERTAEVAAAGSRKNQGERKILSTSYDHRNDLHSLLPHKNTDAALSRKMNRERSGRRTFSIDGNPWSDEAMNSPEYDRKRFSQKVEVQLVQDLGNNGTSLSRIPRGYSSTSNQRSQSSAFSGVFGFGSGTGAGGGAPGERDGKTGSTSGGSSPELQHLQPQSSYIYDDRERSSAPTPINLVDPAAPSAPSSDNKGHEHVVFDAHMADGYVEYPATPAAHGHGQPPPTPPNATTPGNPFAAGGSPSRHIVLASTTTSPAMFPQSGASTPSGRKPSLAQQQQTIILHHPSLIAATPRRPRTDTAESYNMLTALQGGEDNYMLAPTTSGGTTPNSALVTAPKGPPAQLFAGPPPPTATGAVPPPGLLQPERTSSSSDFDRLAEKLQNASMNNAASMNNLVSTYSHHSSNSSSSHNQFTSASAHQFLSHTTSHSYSGRHTRTMSEMTTGSQAEYASPEQTIIIFDWDDTLHPSYYVKSLGLAVNDPRAEFDRLSPALQEGLRELAEISERLIRTALKYGRVVIITNAETGWAQVSCKKWLPDLWELLSEMTVISARSTFEPKGVESPAGWKTHAFREVIEAFYSRYPNQRWKNVLAFGDGRADREALHRVTEERLSEGCRQKNVKFLVKPSLDTLKKQILMCTDVFEHLVHADDHVDIRLEERHLLLLSDEEEGGAQVAGDKNVEVVASSPGPPNPETPVSAHGTRSGGILGGTFNVEGPSTGKSPSGGINSPTSGGARPGSVSLVKGLATGKELSAMSVDQDDEEEKGPDGVLPDDMLLPGAPGGGNLRSSDREDLEKEEKGPDGVMPDGIMSSKDHFDLELGLV